jgi:hypothetical protein
MSRMASAGLGCPLPARSRTLVHVASIMCSLLYFYKCMSCLMVPLCKGWSRLLPYPDVAMTSGISRLS